MDEEKGRVRSSQNEVYRHKMKPIVTKSRPLKIKDRQVMTAQQARDLLTGKGVATVNKKRNHTESKLQQECFKWFRLQYPQYSKLFFAIPNGGARSAIEAKIMQGEGVVPGVADSLLSVPKKYFTTVVRVSIAFTNSNYKGHQEAHWCHGLYIEFKAGKNKKTAEQLQFETEAVFYGYKYEVVRSFDEFEKIINQYLQ